MIIRRSHLSISLSLGLVTSLALVALSDTAHAVSTRTFDIDDAPSFSQGELHHVAVHSDGHVALATGVHRIAMPTEVGLVYATTRGPDGTTYLGTGDDGRIYRLRPGSETPELFAETGQLLVTAMTFVDGTLFAATIPEGRILAIDAQGQSRVLPALADPDGSHRAESVWDLAWRASDRVLFAATGPEGRVYGISLARVLPDAVPLAQVTPPPATPPADAPAATEATPPPALPIGEVRRETVTATQHPGIQLYWDSRATHVMSLALSRDGALYAGTSDDAIVAEIQGPGRVRIAYDFPGNEITDLADLGDHLVVAANEFGEAAAPAPAPAKRSATTVRAARPRPGKGRVYRLERDGRAERLYAYEEGHVTRVSEGSDGVVFAALGAEGRIVRVTRDHESAIWVDVDERQVLALDLEGTDPLFATGDGAAVYRLDTTRPDDPVWLSKVLDAEFAARFGQLSWRGAGQLDVSTRTGNTERPDETWTEWSRPLTRPGPIASPGARFLQVRVSFARDPQAELRAITVHYLPQNQRPLVTEVALKQRPSSRRGEDTPAAPSPMLGLTWKVDNSDGDRLRYRLRFREESQSTWREILRDSETLTATEYQWNTGALPDGHYVVEVEATDELTNPGALTLASRRGSEPILVDNHPPEVLELRAEGTRVSGRARDSLGPITRLEYAVDGGEWHMFFPTDDLLDTGDESFALDVPALAPGDHVVAVRAFDAANNVNAAETTVAVAPATPPPATALRRRGAAR